MTPPCPVRRFGSWTLACLVGCGARSALLTAPEEDAAAVDAAAQDAHRDAAADAQLDVVPDVPSSLLCPVLDADVFDGPVLPLETFVGLQVGAITPSMSSCSVDTAVHQGEEGYVVSWALAGVVIIATGAVFGDGGVVFSGTENGQGVVELCTNTTFPKADGCTWESAQHIDGTLTGAPSSTLAFTYEEQPISGTGCDTACSAQGPVYATSR